PDLCRAAAGPHAAAGADAGVRLVRGRRDPATRSPSLRRHRAVRRGRVGCRFRPAEPLHGARHAPQRHCLDGLAPFGRGLGTESDRGVPGGGAGMSSIRRVFFGSFVSDRSLGKGDRQMPAKGNAKLLWTFAITTVALFMVTLDNLVVTTALPVI